MKLMNKLMIGSAFLTLAVANAHAGFYVGGNVGAGFNKTKGATSAVPAAPVGALNKNTTNLLLNVIVGYLHDFGSNFVLGGEAYVGMGLGSKEIWKATAGNDYIKQKRGFHYGFKVRGGYRFNPQFLGYVTAGLEGGQYKHEYYVAGVKQTEAQLTNLGTVAGHSWKNWQTVSGFRPTVGAGAEYAFSKNWSLGLSYQYMFQLSKNARTAANVEDTTAANKLKISQHAVRVDVKYYF